MLSSQTGFGRISQILKSVPSKKHPNIASYESTEKLLFLVPPGCAESLRHLPTHHMFFYTNIRNSHIDTIVFARTGSIHLITSRFHTLFFTSLGGCSGSKRNPHQVRSISAFIMSPCSRSTRGETAPARTIAAWVHKEKS